MKGPIQSFKKVLNFAPTSRAAATKLDYTLVTGTDSVAAGQTSVSDSQVPTGSVIKFIELQISLANLVSIASFYDGYIGHLRSGQSTIDPVAIGGNPQRNQVMHIVHRSIGRDQNVNITIRYKIPKKFQRVREGDIWHWTFRANTIFTDAAVVIYKFYR